MVFVHFDPISLIINVGQNGLILLFTENIYQSITVLEICRDLTSFWNFSLSHNSSSLKKLPLKLLKFFWWISSSWNSSTIKIFQNFSIELEFMELENHGKLEFPKLKYPKSGRSLHIFEIVLDLYIFQ